MFQKSTRELYQDAFRNFRLSEPHAWSRHMHYQDEARSVFANAETLRRAQAWNAAAESFVDARRFRFPGRAHMPVLTRVKGSTGLELIPLLTPQVRLLSESWGVDISYTGAASLIHVYRLGRTHREAYCTSQRSFGFFERLALGKRTIAHLKARTGNGTDDISNE